LESDCHPLGTAEIAINAPGLVALACAPLISGGFVTAWCSRNRIWAFITNLDGTHTTPRPIGVARNGARDLCVTSIASDIVVISWNEAWLLLRPSRFRIYLGGTTDGSWSSAAAALPVRRLLRATTGQHRDFSTPPQYSIEFCALKDGFDEEYTFEAAVPPEIVGDTYAHPQEISLCVMHDDSILGTWVNLGHSKGNSVKLIHLDCNGSERKPVTQVSFPDQQVHVSAPKVVELANGRCVLGWLRVLENSIMVEFAEYGEGEIRSINFEDLGGLATNSFGLVAHEGMEFLLLQPISTGVVLSRLSLSYRRNR
jgi:hypothetical protein